MIVIAMSNCKLVSRMKYSYFQKKTTFFDNAVLILFYSFVTFKFQIIIIKHSIY